MKPSELISQSAPGSIDLESAAKTQTQSNMRRSLPQKNYTKCGLRAVELLVPERPRTHGRSTASMERPEWTLAEIGQAAYGVPEIAFMAACFSFAGAHGHYRRLHDALFAEALKLRRQLSWPFRISGVDGQPRHYIEHMASMVLDEEARPSVFQSAPSLYANYLEITEELWEGQIEARYAHVKQAYHLWLSDAHRIMAPRLRDDWEG